MATALPLRTKGSRLSILDLPTDILVEVFSHFQHEYFDNHSRPLGLIMQTEALDRLRDVKSARLVCRAFHYFASPHLCPILRLPLERHVLEIANSLAKNSFILKGVRTIEISTLYRPKELAQSLTLFRERRLADLEVMMNECDFYLDILKIGGHGLDDEDVCDHPEKVYLEAKERYYYIHAVWHDDYDWISGELYPGTTVRYERMLEQGYAEYKTKHEEQAQIIADGSFVEAIATLVSHIPHPCSLHFTDDTSNMLRRYQDDPTLLFADTDNLLTDTDELLRFMSTPHDWKTLEELEGGCDLVPSTLLATLPIAIEQHGATLQGVHVGAFPQVTVKFGDCGRPREQLWDDLAACGKRLRTFEYARNSKVIRVEHVQGEDKAHIDRYFGAMLSTPCLEYLRLSFYDFSLNDGTGDDRLAGRHMNMDIGSVISMTPYPLMRRVNIGCISIRQTDLERFCDGLGDALESFHIYHIEMSGSWIGVLDILRRKFSARCREGRCTISFAALYDGEFGPRPVKENRPYRRPLRLPPRARQKPHLIVQSLKYVNGDADVMENPLVSVTVARQ